MEDNFFCNIHFSVHRKTTPSWNIKMRKLKDNELVYVYDGNGKLHIEDCVYPLEKGMLVFIGPNIKNSFETDINNLLKFYAVHFNAEPEVEFKNIYYIKKKEIIKQDFINIYREWKSNDIFHDTQCNIFLCQLLLDISRENIYADFNYANMQKFRKISDYIQKNYQDKITVEKICNIFSISPSYLNDIIKECSGKTFINYVNYCRTEKAKELLANNKSVAESAYMTGFEDPFYFSRIFKKYNKISPSEYKNIIKSSL